METSIKRGIWGLSFISLIFLLSAYLLKLISLEIFWIYLIIPMFLVILLAYLMEEWVKLLIMLLDLSIWMYPIIAGWQTLQIAAPITLVILATAVLY